jgi:hypothetical protein
VFAFVVFEDEAAVDDAGDAVVKGGFGGGVFPGGEEAFAVVGAHGRREADGVGEGQGVFEKKSGFVLRGDGGEMKSAVVLLVGRRRS